MKLLWTLNDSISGTFEAAQWNIVQRDDTFCIQNVMTKEWMYANASKDNDKHRPVLTYERAGGDPLHTHIHTYIHTYL